MRTLLSQHEIDVPVEADEKERLDFDVYITLLIPTYFSLQLFSSNRGLQTAQTAVNLHVKEGMLVN